VSIKRDAADVWFSKAVRARDGGCMYCGLTETNEAAHIYGRRNKAVRWSLDNAVTLCHHHHRMFTESPCHFVSWLESLYGETHMEILREKSQAIFKTTKQIRAEIAKHYRDQVRAHEQDPSFTFTSYN